MRAAGQARKLGRPAHSNKAREQAKLEILKAIHRIGWAGWRDFQKVLPAVPTRLLQGVLKVLKAAHRAKERRRLERRRKSIQVLAKGVLVAQDSTMLEGRQSAEVFKDAGTLRAFSAGDGQPLDAAANLRHLEALKAQEALPLVLAHDNGPGNRAGEVKAFLESNQVCQLFSLPRTPQHNAFVERAIGEAKQEGTRGGLSGLQTALGRINRRPRASKGWKTPVELEAQLPHWSSRVSRQEFFERVQKEISTAACGLEGRAFRIAKREAVFRTLEWFGLILRTRGGQLSKPNLCDTIS